jgi:hypothetical protein
VQPAEHPAIREVVLGRQRRNPEPGQRELDELAVSFRDELGQVGRGPLGRYLRGHHDVDTVRPAVGVRIHPGQDGVQFGGIVEPDAAEHAHPPGPADRGRDVLGRGEPDDRVLDTEHALDAHDAASLVDA